MTIDVNTMNCETFREAVLADPMGDGEARDRHLQQCTECAAFAARVIRFERRLASALAVPVPASLTGDLPLMPAADDDDASGSVVAFGAGRRGRVPAAAERRAPAYRYWGMAAALLVAIVAAVVFRPTLGPGGDRGRLLAEQVFEHVGPELFAMQPASTPVPDARLGAVVPAALATMDRDIGLVSYARSCEINGRIVPHLVVQGERGPVTILLLPEEKLDGAVTLRRDGLDVVVFPVGEGGSVALIGRGEASIEAVRERAQRGISWTT